jgi:pyruvate, water dikinase
MRFLLTTVSIVLCAAACSGQPSPAGVPDAGHTDAGTVDSGTDAGLDCSVCDAAAARLGYRVCVCRVPDTTLWESITVRTGVPGELRATKYMAPARADARLPVNFMDANAFTLHYEFMRQSFPDQYANLSSRDYLKMIQDPAQREFFAGVMTEYMLGGQAVLYGFNIWDDPANAATTITCDQAHAVYNLLKPRFDLVPLAFVPTTANQRSTLAGCDVPMYDPEVGVAYEVYTQGVGYGTLRRYRVTELQAATDNYEFGWQDVLVLDEAPTDVETVISGAMTGTQQGALSHLNVRSAARGTPNCYLNGAYDLLQEWAEKLVRFECGATDWSVTEATPEQAQEFWNALRPAPVTIPEADRNYDQCTGLLDVPTGSPEMRQTAGVRYGAKGSNLAILYQRIDPQYRLDGFVVPFHFYYDFVENHAWTVDLGGGSASHTFAETLTAWFGDPVFRTDSRVRRERLTALQSAMQASTTDADLSSSIRAVFGTDATMLRFRSSSNAEDGLLFNGAGLYDSFSGCLADDLDKDTKGPSLCDANESKEHTLARALTRVWASLWNPEAYDEREWYGIDQSRAAMAVLVDSRVQKELANIVAFSGNPTTPADDRYLVNAQAGELDVVSADPGVYPEVDLLTLQDGAVAAIDRVRGSSEVNAGTWVLDDSRLQQLGHALWQITQVFPIDDTVPTGGSILLDTEWKIRADGQLIVKQVRPFLKQ